MKIEISLTSHISKPIKYYVNKIICLIESSLSTIFNV